VTKQRLILAAVAIAVVSFLWGGWIGVVLVGFVIFVSYIVFGAALAGRDTADAFHGLAVQERQRRAQQEAACHKCGRQNYGVGSYCQYCGAKQ
jgi:hypothetical protein